MICEDMLAQKLAPKDCAAYNARICLKQIDCVLTLWSFSLKKRKTNTKRPGHVGLNRRGGPGHLLILPIIILQQ